MKFNTPPIAHLSDLRSVLPQNYHKQQSILDWLAFLHNDFASCSRLEATGTHGFNVTNEAPKYGVSPKHIDTRYFEMDDMLQCDRRNMESIGREE